jgi:predicted TIM-barrel fold metal-dependent hydrolase
MYTELERLGCRWEVKPTLVLDTFVRADTYFGAPPQHLTTPYTLAELARRHQGLNIVGAHMGGLLADFDEIRRHLVPAPNVFLDTANAAHTLDAEEFVELLQVHGASHILFGTDWPWFLHADEIRKIDSLLDRAGYNNSERDAVFGGNAKRLFGL